MPLDRTLVLESDLEELLRELMLRSGALSVSIGPENQPLAEGALRAALGQGGYLNAVFQGPEKAKEVCPRSQMLEESARSLRSCIKRHQALHWPRLQIPSETPDKRRLILARIQQFLRGLVDTSALHQMVLMCRGQIIASAMPLEALESDRLNLLSRQLDKISVQSIGSNHGELVRSDVYGCSFWYGAALFGFAETEYSIDFVRHRCKQVARELSHLLSMLEEGPDGPVKEAPDPGL